MDAGVSGKGLGRLVFGDCAVSCPDQDGRAMDEAIIFQRDVRMEYAGVREEGDEKNWCKVMSSMEARHNAESDDVVARSGGAAPAGGTPRTGMFLPC